MWAYIKLEVILLLIDLLWWMWDHKLMNYKSMISKVVKLRVAYFRIKRDNEIEILLKDDSSE